MVVPAYCALKNHFFAGGACFQVFHRNESDISSVSLETYFIMVWIILLIFTNKKNKIVSSNEDASRVVLFKKRKTSIL